MQRYTRFFAVMLFVCLSAPIVSPVRADEVEWSWRLEHFSKNLNTVCIPWLLDNKKPEETRVEGFSGPMVQMEFGSSEPMFGFLEDVGSVPVSERIVISISGDLCGGVYPVAVSKADLMRALLNGLDGFEEGIETQDLVPTDEGRFYFETADSDDHSAIFVLFEDRQLVSVLSLSTNFNTSEMFGSRPPHRGVLVTFEKMTPEKLQAFSD